MNGEPRMGTIVHYVNREGITRPAIILDVSWRRTEHHTGEGEGPMASYNWWCLLGVFTTEYVVRKEVPFHAVVSGQPFVGHSWHWPDPK